MNATLRREFRVAFSRRAQPVWFRVLKWSYILTGFGLFRHSHWFWWSLAALAAVGTALHCLYRHKTKTWTRPWGGWNDLEAGRD